ncbi:tetracycline resistance [Fusarium sp. NRRL 52700]|nr:tetracycline resistance [Fusarium sp. NRRL 52700]
MIGRDLCELASYVYCLLLPLPLVLALVFPPPSLLIFLLSLSFNLHLSFGFLSSSFFNPSAGISDLDLQLLSRRVCYHSVPMAESSLGISPHQDLQSIPTAGETSPTFQLFSQLPTELRLKIWKSACLPRSSIFEAGIHYVTVDAVAIKIYWADDDHYVPGDPNLEGHDYDYEGWGYVALRALECPWGKTGNSISPVKPVNKSVYLWDAGLWLACKESRQVVLEHLRFKEWLACRQQPLPRGEYPWYDKAFPSAIVPQNKNEKLYPLVKPHYDIFCLDASNVESIPDSCLKMMLLAPFFGTKKFTVVGSWNLAFKFGRSWNDNFPSSWLDLMQREDSFRSRLVKSIYWSDEAISPIPSIWLMDDNVHWIELSGQSCPRMYRDLEDEYVQIEWDGTGRNMVDENKGAVTDFLAALEQLDGRDNYFADYVPIPVYLLVKKANQLPGFIDEEVFESDSEDGEDGDDESEDGSDEENDWGDTSGEEEA